MPSLGGHEVQPDNRNRKNEVTDSKNLSANQMVPIDNELLRGVEVKLDALLGRGRMTAEELMSLSKGSVVTLENSLADHVELYLNDALVARGEIVAVGDHFGVRITEIAAAS